MTLYTELSGRRKWYGAAGTGPVLPHGSSWWIITKQGTATEHLLVPSFPRTPQQPWLMLECFLPANAVLSPAMSPSDHQPLRCVLLSVAFHSWGNWLWDTVTWPRSHNLQAWSEKWCRGLLDPFPSLPKQTDTHHRLASWCWDLQHPYLLRACWKCRLSGPTPPTLTQHLRFIKIYRCWMCMMQFEKHWIES